MIVGYLVAITMLFFSGLRGRAFWLAMTGAFAVGAITDLVTGFKDASHAETVAMFVCLATQNLLIHLERKGK